MPKRVNGSSPMALAAMRLVPLPDRSPVAIAAYSSPHYSHPWVELCCYDVLDSPDGDDPSLRPNQIFAVSLPGMGTKGYAPLLTLDRQRSIVDTCGQQSLTSHGLRSLAPNHPQYQGHYGGNSFKAKQPNSCMTNLASRNQMLYPLESVAELRQRLSPSTVS
jgi:hypothetical protein